MSWEQLARSEHALATGVAFAILALAALCGLRVHARRCGVGCAACGGILPTVALGVAALWLQGSTLVVLVLLGRLFHELGLFQSMVRLDALVLRLSTPERYSTDFRSIGWLQGIALLLASLSAGAVVSACGPELTFVVALLGFFLGASSYALIAGASLGLRGERALGPARAVMGP